MLVAFSRKTVRLAMRGAGWGGLAQSVRASSGVCAGSVAADAGEGGGGWEARAQPLAGVTVLELEGLAAAPMAGMVLADFGARVIRIDRPPAAAAQTTGDAGDGDGTGSGSSRAGETDAIDHEPHMGTTLTSRGKESVVLDLKVPKQVEAFKALAQSADVVIEPFRAGVMESLGLGPEVLMGEEVNPRLVYARMTGYGQVGEEATAAGHDINYVAATGLLSCFARALPHPTPPTPPINLLGDMAGGAFSCAFGIVLALHARDAPGGTGAGSIVDANMVSGSAYIGSFLYAMAQAGGYAPSRPGTNLLDSGAPFYDTYQTADGEYMALGAIEPKFFAEAVALLGLDVEPAAQYKAKSWPALRAALTSAFASRTAAEWDAVFAGSDACVSRVVPLNEVVANPPGGRFGDEPQAVMPLPAPTLAARDAAAPPAGHKVRMTLPSRPRRADA
ncbi:uncharacterized protein AMSG_07426 [Thecamonas trahens ATCC 50062]|uniref:Alpha-methylacyl-CoA racemase n=1 Tax=Thecamonas trahens ATCC 50062 TaxID=461836 RepID=A0A0L0DGQ9_THETB|nr:hypothetical protein AMSG_07426 [Thecamonas trahens ATCC 50062]KNC51529.1 hypothetical protein AMSG_07426 [Thecamonas trahens ATCC 50062]|eukprot:XP_013755932.1 hypothetical protein AMSG_07426 [Thecamonas trahens ATCC 50062]